MGKSLWKKISISLGLITLSLLSSCGHSKLRHTYYLGNKDIDDNYIYTCELDYDSGALLLKRQQDYGDTPITYLTYDLGSYEIAYSPRPPLLLDYGNYAIWRNVMLV